MFIKQTIQVSSPWLGAVKNTTTGIREFYKDSNTVIQTHNILWRENFAAAGIDLGFTLDKNSFRFPSHFTISEPLAVETRVYSGGKKERFESINVGITIPVEFVYMDSLMQLTEGDMYKIIVHIGKFYGLSPWGNKFGYGRFEIKDDNV